MPICKCCKRWYDLDEHENDYGNDVPQDLCPQCLFDNDQTFDDPEDGEIRVDDEEFDDEEYQNDDEDLLEDPQDLDDEDLYTDLLENDEEYAN